VQSQWTWMGMRQKKKWRRSEKRLPWASHIIWLSRRSWQTSNLSLLISKRRLGRISSWRMNCLKHNKTAIHLSTVATCFEGIFFSATMTCQVFLSLELLYFLYPHIEDIVSFKFGGLGTHVVPKYAANFNLWFEFH
jgi:hypothetical protein